MLRLKPSIFQLKMEKVFGREEDSCDDAEAEPETSGEFGRGASTILAELSVPLSLNDSVGKMQKPDQWRSLGGQR